MEKIGAKEFVSRLRSGETVRNVEVGEPVCVVGAQPIEPAVSIECVRFLQTVHFEDVQFAQRASFCGCQFEAGGWFPNSVFCGEADFSNSFFGGAAYFWRARFLDAAKFDDSVIVKEAPVRGNVDKGELNLSWAQFRKQASFVRVRCHGPARLWRTLFRDSVVMDESLFGDVAVFMGAESEVSIDVQELGGLPVYELLIGQGLLRRDPEVPKEKGRWFRFGQLNANSVAELRGQLEGAKVPVDVASSLIASFEEDSRPMFSPSHGASLCRIEVGSGGRITLIDMDLRHCRLLGTPMADAQLVNVRWPERRILCGAVKRHASADEVPGLGRPELYQLQQLYRELATCYGRRNEEPDAGRFRIAEREVARKNEGFGVRLLAEGYRILSAFGESPGIALSWLAAFVLGVFPLLYLAVSAEVPAGDLPETFWRLQLRSLEVSTFLKGSEEALSDAGRVVAGVERLLVTLQAALFGMALKRLGPRSGG